MPIHRFFLSDFVEIQRKSFFELLETGLINEFSKRNPITNVKKDLELFFYPEYYKLTIPEFQPYEAILRGVSYTSKLYVPVQLTDKKSKTIKLKWCYIGNLPLMTKRGHFILNGAARVIINQILRSPGIYYQEKRIDNFKEKWSQQPESSYKRHYADLISLRGTWLRIEIDKDKNIWAQTKKGPKIPVLWLLLGMGLPERIILKSILEPSRLVQNLEYEIVNEFSSLQPKPSRKDTASTKHNPQESPKKTSQKKKQNLGYPYVKNPPEAWKEIYCLVCKIPSILLSQKNLSVASQGGSYTVRGQSPLNRLPLSETTGSGASLVSTAPVQAKSKNPRSFQNTGKNDKNFAEEGRKWLFNKFMNPRTYDLGNLGRLAFNKKLGLNISPDILTLTPQDLLYATDYLIKVEKGQKKIDDIDHLKNRRVRTSGELIQIQIGIGLVRLEKAILDKMNKISSDFSLFPRDEGFLRNLNPISKKQINVNNGVGEAEQSFPQPVIPRFVFLRRNSLAKKQKAQNHERQQKKQKANLLSNVSWGWPTKSGQSQKNFNKINRKITKITLNNIVNSKAFNSALREFFGTSPLSQFMDQINPLAEITHKRRLSSMGPGGVTRDTATLAIRGIHPTHYGRICPIETPEGKNTGLVNSMTTYARVNHRGMLESPFYKVYKGQVQKKTGMFFLSAEHEEKVKLAAADLFVSSIGFLPKSSIPVRIAEDFTKIARNDVEYIGVSPIQMVSIATSLIPFLEHDDANRALMGSNMQRQAVPLIRAERPIVGTGLEARAVSDSGHVIQAKFSGLVTYVSGDKIIVYKHFPRWDQYNF